MEPLAYRACDLPKVLPLGPTKIKALLRSGELESFTVGRARFVTRQALEAFMARQVAAQRAGSSRL